MTSIINAAPRAYLRGVQDLSGRAPVYEPEAIPQHLPHVFLLTERGTGVPQIAIGDGLNKLYGAKSFDLRLKAGEGGYATHQTLLATIMSQNANQIMAQRLIPNDATTSRFRLVLDVLNSTDVIYDRDEDGMIKRNNAGRPIDSHGASKGNWDMFISGGQLPDASGLPTVAPAGAPGAKYLDLVAGTIKYWDVTTSTFISAGTMGSGVDALSVPTGLTITGDYWTLVSSESPAPVTPPSWLNLVYKATKDNPGVLLTANWGPGNPAIATKVLAWSIKPITTVANWGQGTIVDPGPFTDGTNLSKSYPILDFEVSSAGKWGDLAGIRFSAPSALSAIPFDTRLIKEQLTTMFRMQVVERADVNSSAKVIETRYGEQFIDFSLKPNAVNDRTSQEIYLPAIYDNNYISYDTVPPSFGTFSGIHVYEANISTVLQALYTQERAALANELGWSPAQVDNMIPVDGKYTINFFTAVAWDGNVYETIRMATDIDLLTIPGGTEMKSNYTQYAQGGSDGDTSYANFDAMVAFQCENYGDLIVKRDPNATDPDPSDVPLDFMDTAKWPQSAIWDSGFNLATKYKLLVPMGRRKDIWTALSTQECGPGSIQNSANDESSTAIILQQAARMYPESEYYGTKTCRAIVVGHSGELTSSAWRGLAPMSMDLAAKVASYMGASNGQWIPGKNFDISPKNIVSMFRTDSVNATFKNADVRNEDWANGLIWVQNFDRRSLFYPGIQTVYDDDTSVLNSLFNIIAVVELEKVCEQTWRELTGIQTLTVAQFIERSDKLITDKVANRFDDKFIIVPETYLTEGDEQRGYSWSCKVNMYAANMRTVGTYTIVSRRIEDYQP